MSHSQYFIISGGQGEGKTSRCLEIINLLKTEKQIVGGVLALGFWENNVRSGFELVDVRTEQKIPFASRKPQKGWGKIKSFYFNPIAITIGEEVLGSAIQQCDWIVLDELGQLDSQGELWGPIFTELNKIPNKKWILCIRDIFVDELIRFWQLENVKVMSLEEELSMAIKAIL